MRKKPRQTDRRKAAKPADGNGSDSPACAATLAGRDRACRYRGVVYGGLDEHGRPAWFCRRHAPAGR